MVEFHKELTEEEEKENFRDTCIRTGFISDLCCWSWMVSSHPLRAGQQVTEEDPGIPVSRGFFLSLMKHLISPFSLEINMELLCMSLGCAVSFAGKETEVWGETRAFRSQLRSRG